MRFLCCLLTALSFVHATFASTISLSASSDIQGVKGVHDVHDAGSHSAPAFSISSPMMIAIEGVNYNSGEFNNKEFACLLNKPL